MKRSIFSIIAFSVASLPLITNAGTLYFGGDILTMVGKAPQYAETLLVEKGIIDFVGDKAKAIAIMPDNTELVDLKGKTLLPGFFDAHSHFLHTSIKLSTVNLDPMPAGNITSIGDIIIAMKNELKANPRKDGEWLFGWGYDNGMLKENRHPNKFDLDKISKTIPIAIYHFSGHGVVLNTQALKIMGFTDTSVAPEGGVIRRMPNSKEPSGILEETSIYPVINKLLASAQGKKLVGYLLKSQEIYQSKGFTTMTEMASTPDAARGLMAFAKSGLLENDLVTMMIITMQDGATTAKQYSREYKDHFRIGGGKINIDGGSPGRTAFLRAPYYTQGEGQKDDYRGYPSIEKQEDLNAHVEKFYELKTPVYIHALGDAAIDNAIIAVDSAQKKFPRDDIRTQLIHLQLLHDDQLDLLEGLDVTLTFQNTHNFYFSDFHNKYTFGPKRTEKLAPMKSAIKRGFSTTFHHDSPVHPVNQIDLMWIATNRSSRSGKVYGAEEIITVYEALRAATIEPAYQFFEENHKGSLEKGKLADLVILDKNPLKVAREVIRDIQVLQTIKEGNTVWSIQ